MALSYIFRYNKSIFETLINSYRQCTAVRQRKVSKKTKKKKYSDTVFLPKTSFPLHIPASKRIDNDLLVYDKCKFDQLYEWQRQNKKGKEFILHDGPPYANGDLHMGHAVNKILKDVTIRQKFLQGFKINFVPGWDCHGLPIELKAINAESIENLSAIEIRAKARTLATKAIENQKITFQTWGIMTNWKESYLTFSKEYIKNQFHQFYNLYQKGLIYRDMKPVYWSPSSRTALAEAELLYNDQYVSKSVLMGLPVKQISDCVTSTLSKGDCVTALIWTTTPWTLPANQAICYNPNISYCIASVQGSNGSKYLLAADAVQEMEKILCQEITVLNTFPGHLLENATYSHPIEVKKELPFLPGLHVTSKKGSGLVHTAPAHGPDDFLVALKYNIPIVNIVDNEGCYSADAGDSLEGLFVLNEGNSKVLDMVKSLVLNVQDYVHSYPCDWRTKAPIIIKASFQWFIDTDAIKKKAIELLQEISVYPKKFECHSTLISQLEKRPYWCISRQRVWGTPIPVLYQNNDERPILSRDLINHYNQLLDVHGPDFWWSLSKETLFPSHLLEIHDLTLSTVERGKDILDIWFDSGISWSHVIGEEKVADLYLEGMDQYTGWFQSSLMTSVALRRKSPFRSLYVHGFAVDEKGYKMSKSVGNVVDPHEITHGGKDKNKQPALGADTLRWWVASHASQHASVPVSQSILESSATEVQKIRSVMRFLLGCLFDYSLKDRYTLEEFYSLDLWMLHKLKIFENQVLLAYNNYQYNQACKIILNFVTNEVSSVYCHMIKDRLYCRQRNDFHRLSCQYVLKHTLEMLLYAVAPIMPYLVEEVYLHHPCKTEEKPFFYSDLTKLPEHWHFPEAEEIVKTALAVKEILNKKESGNTMSLHVVVFATGKYLGHLRKLSEGAELNELLEVSSSEVRECSSNELSVETESASGSLCQRCRQYTSANVDILCRRCEVVVKEIYSVPL